MNGINYNTLLGNTGLFSQQTNTVADELKYKGTSTKEKTTDKKQTNADHDTVESMAKQDSFRRLVMTDLNVR